MLLCMHNLVWKLVTPTIKGPKSDDEVHMERHATICCQLRKISLVYDPSVLLINRVYRFDLSNFRSSTYVSKKMRWLLKSTFN